MKITKSELKEIIKEVLNEDSELKVDALPPDIIKTLKQTENWKPGDVDYVRELSMSWGVYEEDGICTKKDLVAFLKNNKFKRVWARSPSTLSIVFKK